MAKRADGDAGYGGVVERGHDEAVDVGEGFCRNPAGTNEGGVDDMVKHSWKVE